MALLPTAEQLASLDKGDHITRDYQRELARMGRASLFFFARYLFGRTGLNTRAHVPLCNAAQKIIVTPNALGVFEDPRATGKSNAITIPGPAWCLIQDPAECKRRGWLPLGPEQNIMVASYKTDIAAIFTNDTRLEMESNPLFAWLYGDIVPAYGSQKGSETWSKEKFTVNRKSGTGFSVMAIGTESGSTSLHPRVLFIDDLVNEINYKSASEVAAQVNWTEHSNNLTDIMFGSRVITQNSWTERDVNFGMRDKNKKAPRSVFFFSRSRIVCDLCQGGRKLDEYGNPIPCGSGWEHPLPARPILDHYVSDKSDPPKPYTREDVDRLKATLPAAIWWAQHENNPLAQAELKWRESWLRYFTIETRPESGDKRYAVLVVGQGGLSGNDRRPDPDRLLHVPCSSMSVIVSLDPGLHRPGISCVGRIRLEALGDMLFILETCTDPLSPRDQFFLMFDWTVKWGAHRMCFERVGLQNYIQQTIPAMAESYQRERGVELPYWITRPNPEANRIVGVQVYKREGDKTARIGAALSPFAEQRLIAVQRANTAFIDEYVIFDKGKYMDGLDSVAMTIKAAEGLNVMTDAERVRHRLAGRAALALHKESNLGPNGYGEGV